MHARIENGLVVEYPIINLRQRLPGFSLPADLSNDSLLPAGFVYVAPAPLPEFNPLTHRLAPTAPALSNSRWVQAYELVLLTDADAQAIANGRAAQQEAARKQAYQDEADPTFFQWQRGEATQAQWLSKINEIKARFPTVP